MIKTLEYLEKRFAADIHSPIVRLTQVNRTMLASVFHELSFTVGAEIGVAEGVYSEILLKNIPDLTLHLVDPWETYPGFYEDKNLPNMYNELERRLTGHSAVFHKCMSMDAVKEFSDNSLDFVFIDASHDFKNVACDISEWSKKVRPGGIVFGHDYKFHGEYVQKYEHHPPKLRHAIEVKIVADAYRDAKRIRPWFEIYPEILDPNFGRDNPCFMFVRQETDRL